MAEAMTPLLYLIPEDVRQQIQQKVQTMEKDSFNLQNYDFMRAAWMNAEEGALHKLDGIQCEKCRNKGVIYYFDGDYFMNHQCECMKQRLMKRRMTESGLGRLLERCTFDSYRTDEPWQNIVKELAMKYSSEPNRMWLFVSGQPGSGKTHICTAVCNHLIQNGNQVSYKIWGDLFRELDANVYHYEVRQRIIEDIRNAEILYIDDFLKNYKAYSKMAAIAFDVINERYNVRKPLILSTEYTLEEIKSIDTALAGRIDEMTYHSKIQIREAKERDIRTRR